MHATSGSAGPSRSRKMRQCGSMSNGCVRKSKKACGDRAAGRAVHIDDILWRESRPTRVFEFEGYDRQTPPDLADAGGGDTSPRGNRKEH